MKKIKIYFTKQLLTCLFVLFCCIRANAAPQSIAEQIQTFADEGSISNLVAAKAGIESLWPNDPPLYFQCNNQFEEALEKLAKTNSIALEELQTQARQALVRSCPTNSIDATSACFDAKRQIAMRLVKNFNPSISNALVLANFLGDIRTTIITNYQRIPVFANVTPPLTPTNNNGMGYFSGMAPYAIADPAARAAYEKAISNNNNNGKMNDFQIFTLPEINRAMTSRFLSYVGALSVKEAITKKQSNLLAQKAHLTKPEERRLK